MNKIKIVDDVLEVVTLNSDIELEEIPKNEFFEVTTMILKVKKDTDLLLEYSTRVATKLNIKIEVEKDIRFNIIEYRYGKNFKVQYSYNLYEDSFTNIYKFYDVKGIKEMNMIYLLEENAKINYYFNTISNGCEKYNMTIYHQAKNTTSNIINNGVNILKGNLTFNISSFVTEKSINCDVMQESRIINLTNNKCQINPNLFIDEYDVNASHSAHIGTFDKEEMFYLNSRGIDNKNAQKLLVTGLLIKDMPNFLISKIKRNINKYWR